MINFLKNNFKNILFFLIGIIVLYLTVYFATPKPEMSELDKYKLEQLDKDIELLIENQKKLDSKISEYKEEISKIDSALVGVKNEKTIIKEYYKDKSDEIIGMKRSQIDSLFHKRYKY
jgi:chromosome segregation ATPase